MKQITTSYSTKKFILFQWIFLCQRFHDRLCLVSCRLTLFDASLRSPLRSDPYHAVFNPREVTAGVPRRTPLVTNGDFGSFGMVFLLQVMLTESRSFSTAFPVRS